jgi:uncharacterized membrane protein YccC
MEQLTWREAVFSLKTFAAAMLAVWIAFRMALPQPSWAMLTVYVVSQPLAGMVLSKSLFRVVGTVVGAAMALLLVGLLAQAPEPFLLLLAAWIGACTFAAVYLRDVPSSYGAVLSGYTAAIVGLPAALAPTTAFDQAWARVLEITLGIACAALVSRLVLPRTAGRVLEATLGETLAAAAQWTADVLRGQGEAAQGLLDRRKLVGDIVALESLRVHAVFDTPEIRAADLAVRHLQARLMMLLSVLVGIYDRLAILRRERPAAVERLRPLLARAAEVLPAGGGESLELARETAALRPDFAELQRDRHLLLDASVLLRLDEVGALWREIRDLEAQVRGGGGAVAAEPPPLARYRDPALAAAGALVSSAAVLAAGLFWLASGWSHGTQAVIFAGVVTAILAGLDDPVTAATGFLKMTAWGTLVGAVYLFGVLPAVDGFWGLAAVLLPFYLPFGMIIALPRIGTAYLPLVLNTTALIGITNERAPPELAAYLDGAFGLLAGAAVAVLAFRLLRPIGVGWTVRRLVAGTMTDLARLARPGPLEPRLAFESRMYDRLGALFARLDAGVPEQRATLQGTLAALRVGLNIRGLRAVRPKLPTRAAHAVDAALIVLRRKLSDGSAPSPLPALERAMAALLEVGPHSGVTRALVVLGGIHTSLQQHPAFFALAPAPDAAPVEAARPVVPA